jgi:hypothetical protein
MAINTARARAKPSPAVARRKPSTVKAKTATAVEKTIRLKSGSDVYEISIILGSTPVVVGPPKPPTPPKPPKLWKLELRLTEEPLHGGMRVTGPSKPPR